MWEVDGVAVVRILHRRIAPGDKELGEDVEAEESLFGDASGSRFGD